MSATTVTDVLEAMWRRRMHRYFAPAPLDDATLGLLSAIQPELEREKQKVMTDREAFVAWLDDLAGRFAVEAKQRRTLPKGESE